MAQQKILIMGAAGRDFHNFNVFFRGNEDYKVVAFTATQIPDIDGRTYPAELAGEGYPNGIPIHAEEKLEELIREHEVDQVVFSYSDVAHEFVMHQASRVIAAGADFRLLGAARTQLKSKKPVISICAARTGCGKSQTTRHVAAVLQAMGKKVAAVRHPMPYGDLVKQRVQRFAELSDLDKHECTIEEREEYEPHIVSGVIVYAGVDYEAILRQVEEEADVVLWDGGNNDLPFFKSDLEIVVVDPLRAGHEMRYHPGEANVRCADVIVINKVDAASAEDLFQVRENIELLNPAAVVVEAASYVTVEQPETIKGKRVLIVEDGPTLTHGEMAFGAGYLVARKLGAAEIVDPRPFAKGSIVDTYAKYPTTGKVLPAMGYGDKQMKELEDTINAADVDTVVVGTPIDLGKLLNLNKPAPRVEYGLSVIGKPNLEDMLKEKFS